jgi:hypothetical protein
MSEVGLQRPRIMPWGAAVAFGTMLVSAVWAHDKHHPELSAWFKSLANSHGTPAVTVVTLLALRMWIGKRSVRLAQANVTIRFA